MLSVCVTCKERSRVETPQGKLLLFPNFAQSLTYATKLFPFPVELVVSDFGSTDYPLEEWLPQTFHPANIVKGEGKFNRGKGLNLAAKNAQYPNLCFLDTDMLVGPAFLALGMLHLKMKQAFFPICWSYSDPEHKEGWWRKTGKGINFVTREMYNRVGGWKEKQSWGREDDYFMDRIALSQRIARYNCPELFHQWHPNDIQWKNRYIVE